MKRLTDLKRITLMIIFIAISLGTYAQVRDFHRLASYTYSWNNYSGGSEHGDMTYHYNPLFPALLDSQTNHYFHPHEHNQEIDCVSYLEALDEGIRVNTEYYINGMPSQRVSNEIDQSGRFVHHLWEKWRPNVEYNVEKEIFRHYNSFGYADSIRYQGSSGSLGGWCVNRYFDGETLTHSILSFLSSGVWTPREKYSFSYSQTPVVLPGFIRFDTIESQQQAFSLYMNEAECNPKVIPDSIVRSFWFNGNWLPDSDYQYFQSIQDGQVIIGSDWYNSIGPSEGNLRIHCSLNGNIEQFSSYHYNGGDEGGTANASFSWYPLPVDDESYAPPAPEPLKLYPNPFSERLNIVIEVKTDPADISIYNTRGQLIRSWRQTGNNDLIWDGKDTCGKDSPQGLYFIKIRIKDQIYTSKAIRMN